MTTPEGITEGEAPSEGTPGYIPARAVSPESITPVLTVQEQLEQPVPPPQPASWRDVPLLTEIDFSQYLGQGPDEGVERLPVEKLLANALPWYTPGGSLMGWSKLRTAKYCLRQFYYQYVLGLVEKRDPEYLETEPVVNSTDPQPVKRTRKTYLNPLALGTLVHACIEAWYRTGSPTAMWGPVEAVKVHHPALALETRRLVGLYLRRYSELEEQTWDNRAVERESRYYFAPRKCCGKKRALCVSARHDGIYRSIRPGEARLPPGKAGNNIYIHEVKTTATLTYNRTQGFLQNAQLMMGLLTYNHGHAVRWSKPDANGNRTSVVLAQSTADLFGPAWGCTVTWIGKAARGDLQKDIDRMDYVFPPERVLEFAADIEDWYYQEVADRLFSQHWQAVDTWRKDWSCADRHMPGWVCPYLSLCAAGNSYDTSVQYDVENPLDRTLLERPAALAKLERSAAKTAATVEAK